MTVPVRIVFSSGAAEWLVDEAAWRQSAGHVPVEMEHSVPNIEEWESFWRRRAAHQIELDARDLNFDGDPVRSADWAFRGRRWVSLRGRGAPASGLPDCYSVVRFDEGWVLFDEILDQFMFLVTTRTAH